MIWAQVQMRSKTGWARFAIQLYFDERFRYPGQGWDSVGWDVVWVARGGGIESQ